jgi:hypothetical protein
MGKMSLENVALIFISITTYAKLHLQLRILNEDGAKA